MGSIFTALATMTVPAHSRPLVMGKEISAIRRCPRQKISIKFQPRPKAGSNTPCSPLLVLQKNGEAAPEKREQRLTQS